MVFSYRVKVRLDYILMSQISKLGTEEMDVVITEGKSRHREPERTGTLYPVRGREQ